MKNLFLCNDQVGLDIFNWLIDLYRDDIGLVVTIRGSRIEQAAEESGVTCLSVASQQQLLNTLCESNQIYDWGFLVWWPWILDSQFFRLSRHGFINTHPSLLPYNRGKHYNFWALVEQVPFGVSLHFVDEGIDCGDIVAQRRIHYGWEDNGATLYEAATREMVELFKEVYPLIGQGSFSRTSQDLSKGSFHRSSDMEDASRIDLDAHYTARHLFNLLRARTFPGHPACWFQEDGHVYEVRVEIRRRHP